MAGVSPVAAAAAAVPGRSESSRHVGLGQRNDWSIT